MAKKAKAESVGNVVDATTPGDLGALMAGLSVKPVEKKKKQGTPEIEPNEELAHKIHDYVVADARKKASEANLSAVGESLRPELNAEYIQFVRNQNQFCKTVSFGEMNFGHRKLSIAVDNAEARKSLQEIFGMEGYKKYFATSRNLTVRSEMMANQDKMVEIVKIMVAALAEKNINFGELFEYSENLNLAFDGADKDKYERLLVDAIKDASVEAKVAEAEKKGLMKWGTGTITSTKEAIAAASENLAKEEMEREAEKAKANQQQAVGAAIMAAANSGK